MSKHRLSAFTLAEMLIALLILGQIATFTIPKIIQAQQQGRNEALGKEAVAMVADAYNTYKLKYTASAATSPADLTAYFNYASVNSIATVDDRPNGTGTITCDARFKCLLLQNGAVLHYDSNVTFGGTAGNKAIWFKLDPDGKPLGTAASQSLTIWIYLNGRVTTYCCILSGTEFDSVGGTFVRNPGTTDDPTWFTWD